VITLRHSLTAGMVALVLLLAALGPTVHMGLSAWGVGLACGALVSLSVATRAIPWAFPTARTSTTPGPAASVHGR
jgi:hypothetical protein